MMMSKAKPEAKAEADSAAAPKKKAAAAATGDAAVADLERRLAELSSATPHIPAVVVPSGMTAAAAAGGSNAAAATMPPPAAAASAAAGNKNALLVSARLSPGLIHSHNEAVFLFWGGSECVRSLLCFARKHV